MNAMIFVKGVTVLGRNSGLVKHPSCAQAAGEMNDRYALQGSWEAETGNFRK